MQNMPQTASTIATAIGAAEHSMSLALRDSGLLIAALTSSHIESDLPIEMDHEALEGAATTVTLLIDGRRRYVEMHRRMAALGRKLGLDETAWGQCTSPSGALPASQRLRAVS